MKDKYSSMKNIKAHIDFAENTGHINLKNHSLGIGGVHPHPMPEKVIAGTAKLNPKIIRIFIQEFFFIEKNNGELDFSVLDKYMRSVTATGADIMASICIKPKSLYPVVDETVWKPNDINKWQYIIGEMAKRYSVENKYVTHWGVANEINIGEYGGCPYLIKNAQDYFEYYKMTVEPILKIYPEAKVGGPSWAGIPDDNGCKFLDEFINSCIKEKMQLDFISYNVYSDSPEYHADGALRVKNIIDKYNNKIELYVTELNVDLGGISVEERAYTPQRSAGIGAIIQEFHKRAKFINTFQYHIYDQFCNPNQFSPFYARARYMANHWSDESHRLGLFDENGNPRPQYFLYSMLYFMAENEVAANIENAEECKNIRINASYNDRYNTIFITNYNSESTEDLTMTMQFKNAREGTAKMIIYRIDENKNWDGDKFELIPAENRTVYVHGDFHPSLYIPKDSVVMIVFDYDV
ncbi:MAG: glycosyl hydrolase [Oscillospiraceae bacterium]|nr:glycosyl hydrolase [Oscillospiraceae bacterium]